MEYESIPEKIGVGIMTLHIAAGHLGRLLRQAVGGASPKGW
ncbi:MAG TPA: hypothetical protein VFW52_00240 [Candidatus Saccharimonadales bacterium]|nr:hypothetical protein [Candidatus Saccharimonadales bacterium]